MLKLIDATPGALYDEFKPIGKPTEEGKLHHRFAVDLPKQMKEAGIPAIEITGGGEPTLWPYFDEIIENLYRNGIEIGLVTNGSNLSSDRIKLLVNSLTWIRFSMDAATQETHRKVHRTQQLDFERRLNTLQNMITYRKNSGNMKRMTIGISYILTPDNLEDIEKAIVLFKTYGTDNIRFSWMYDKSGKAGLDYKTIESIKSNLSELKKTHDSDTFKVLFEAGRIETYSEPNDDFDTCYMQHFVWAIGADNLVYPCCIVKYWPKMAIADIREKTLKQIIEDQNVLAKMHSLDPKGCPPCWLKPRNKAIGSAVEKPKHANFI